MSEKELVLNMPLAEEKTLIVYERERVPMQFRWSTNLCFFSSVCRRPL